MRRSVITFCDAALKDQWRHYSGLCGKWKGIWCRYSADAAFNLTPTSTFKAVCHPKLSEDGESVHHVNFYDSVAEPQVKLADGKTMHAVDHGKFDVQRFRQPFGPHSAAIYAEGAAALATASITPECDTVAVELIAAACLDGRSRHRRRLVAVWKRGPHDDSKQDSVAHLTNVTAIVEEEDSVPKLPDDPSHVERCSAQDAVLDGSRWCGERALTEKSGMLHPSKPYQLDSSPHYQLIGGIHAWLPSCLVLGSNGQVEVGMGWRFRADEYMRVGAVYYDSDFNSVAKDILRRDT
eukprot:TRINITY_DN26657_c0_g1_i1.p1 TRINITY_DN26657_c0_g1~~TRINITY_DN26657_c0_g1_i1.p1  ORF type:complete len:294 (+),score=22.57 TRINITY_DN26657_c0_g1_i1:118-999(+)